ncbi:tRNA pseudouridine38-40 synthase [Natranaerovirga pectinivora]|uniref:tRNA pseudouridine synthase A n=1 Tax=Natranaerovirga pectinivora TaxID=682400 RepID=A0A4R3MEE6_9FIRM|nr:tRNA pseudouridine(38-40) synthase TruA [Natranaerovirga pectinivora]TCT12168.1 tRNA pseudouridine38-40 synthase [Natranaerovirga pectinivora]
MNKRNIRLDIIYDGTKYLGWQRLQNSDKTIQGKIEQVLSRMTNEEIEIIGSGRTDAGVHGRGQVANFYTFSQKSVENIKEYLNQYLPKDIAITEVTEVGERFHSRYNVTKKTYLYRIWTKDFPPVFEDPYTYWYNKPLDIEKMKEASLLLVGKKDYQSFSNKKTKKSTVRDIKDITIEITDDELKIYITADGFLYNMVRIIVGTLIEVGEGKTKIQSIKDMLEAKERANAGERAPAKGLSLYKVYYD